MNIYSGKVKQGVVGTATEFEDQSGKELHVGDIVIVWSGDYIGTDLEQWTPTKGLTAIVCDEDGPFVMGIKNCGFDDEKWRIQIVKKHWDVIQGEHWPEYGFNYL